MIIRKLIWDEWNIAHIARHHVEREEVEEVLEKRHLFERGRDDTYQITGQTQSGRYLAIILVQRGGGNFYPVTARDADNKEKKRFKEK